MLKKYYIFIIINFYWFFINKKILNKIGRYQLRNKLEKIISKSKINTCNNYQKDISMLNFKINNFYEQDFYRNNIINNSINFSYSSNNKEENDRKNKIIDYNIENEIDYNKERDYIMKLIFEQLTFNEIKLINQDTEFYIRDPFIRRYLIFFNERNDLYKTLRYEENLGIKETENDKLKRLIKKTKKIIIDNHNNEIKSKSLNNLFIKHEINKEIKKEIKVKKIIKEKVDSERIKNKLILKNIFFNTKNEIKNKVIPITNYNKQYLILEKSRNRNLEKLLGNYSEKNCTLNNTNKSSISINKSLSSNSKINIYNNKSKTFKTVSSKKYLKKDYKNIKIKLLKNKCNNNDINDSMIKNYCFEIKSNFSQTKNKEKSLPFISN